MRMYKYLIFKVKDKRMGIKTKQVVNMLKNVTLPENAFKSKLVAMVNIWGLQVPIINLHKIIDEESDNKQTKHILLVEIVTDKKKELVGLTIDEICEVALLDDLISYPFEFQPSTAKVKFKDMIIMHENESLVVLNVAELWKFCQGSSIFSSVYLAN